MPKILKLSFITFFFFLTPVIHAALSSEYKEEILKPTLLYARIKNSSEIEKFLKMYEASNKDKEETVEVLLEAQDDVNGTEQFGKSTLFLGKIEIKKFTDLEKFLKKYSASFSNAFVSNKELVITIKSVKNKVN